MTAPLPIAGLILAGGEGRRMGGADKALLPFAGGTLLSAVQARLAPQVGRLALSANGDPARFADFGLPVLADLSPERLGPMAGLARGLAWAAGAGADWLATVAVDAPFLPPDLVARLSAPGGLAIAASGGRIHPTFGLWPVRLGPAVDAALAGGERRIGQWALAQGAVVVEFAAGAADPFQNLNSPDDLARAEARARQKP